MHDRLAADKGGNPISIKSNAPKRHNAMLCIPSSGWVGICSNRGRRSFPSRISETDVLVLGLVEFVQFAHDNWQHRIQPKEPRPPLQNHPAHLHDRRHLHLVCHHSNARQHVRSHGLLLVIATYFWFFASIITLRPGVVDWK